MIAPSTDPSTVYEIVVWFETAHDDAEIAFSADPRIHPLPRVGDVLGRRDGDVLGFETDEGSFEVKVDSIKRWIGSEHPVHQISVRARPVDGSDIRRLVQLLDPPAMERFIDQIPGIGPPNWYDHQSIEPAIDDAVRRTLNRLVHAPHDPALLDAAVTALSNAGHTDPMRALLSLSVELAQQLARQISELTAARAQLDEGVNEVIATSTPAAAKVADTAIRAALVAGRTNDTDVVADEPLGL